MLVLSWFSTSADFSHLRDRYRVTLDLRWKQAQARSVFLSVSPTRVRYVFLRLCIIYPRESGVKNQDCFWFAIATSLVNFQNSLPNLVGKRGHALFIERFVIDIVFLTSFTFLCSMFCLVAFPISFLYARRVPLAYIHPCGYNTCTTNFWLTETKREVPPTGKHALYR